MVIERESSLKGVNMDKPLKHLISYIINTKCSSCLDISFCKLKYYYSILENPKIHDLNNLTKCLFYKKQAL